MICLIVRETFENIPAILKITDVLNKILCLIVQEIPENILNILKIRENVLNKRINSIVGRTLENIPTIFKIIHGVLSKMICLIDRGTLENIPAILKITKSILKQMDKFNSRYNSWKYTDSSQNYEGVLNKMIYLIVRTNIEITEDNLSKWFR